MLQDLHAICPHLRCGANVSFALMGGGLAVAISWTLGMHRIHPGCSCAGAIDRHVLMNTIVVVSEEIAAHFGNILPWLGAHMQAGLVDIVLFMLSLRRCWVTWMDPCPSPPWLSDAVNICHG